MRLALIAIAFAIALTAPASAHPKNVRLSDEALIKRCVPDLVHQGLKKLDSTDPDAKFPEGYESELIKATLCVVTGSRHSRNFFGDKLLGFPKPIFDTVRYDLLGDGTVRASWIQLSRDRRTFDFQVVLDTTDDTKASCMVIYAKIAVEGSFARAQASCKYASEDESLRYSREELGGWMANNMYESMSLALKAAIAMHTK